MITGPERTRRILRDLFLAPLLVSASEQQWYPQGATLIVSASEHQRPIENDCKEYRLHSGVWYPQGDSP